MTAMRRLSLAGLTATTTTPTRSTRIKSDQRILRRGRPLPTGSGTGAARAGIAHAAGGAHKPARCAARRVGGRSHGSNQSRLAVQFKCTTPKHRTGCSKKAETNGSAREKVGAGVKKREKQKPMTQHEVEQGKLRIQELEESVELLKEDLADAKQQIGDLEKERDRAGHGGGTTCSR